MFCSIELLSQTAVADQKFTIREVSSAQYLATDSITSCFSGHGILSARVRSFPGIAGGRDFVRFDYSDNKRLYRSTFMRLESSSMTTEDIVTPALGVTPTKVTCSLLSDGRTDENRFQLQTCENQSPIPVIDNGPVATPDVVQLEKGTIRIRFKATFTKFFAEGELPFTGEPFHVVLDDKNTAILLYGREPQYVTLEFDGLSPSDHTLLYGFSSSPRTNPSLCLHV